MTLVTLSDVLGPALANHRAVAGLVVLGWEDARAFVDAAQDLQAPLILQVGPGARASMPLPVWAVMFRTLAEGASVPVVAHLDHGSVEECRAAVDLGFTSVMYDGSRLPLAENIAQTAAVVQMAQAAGVSVEAELGFVGYSSGAASSGTDPLQAAEFWRDTGVDALAVSVGNVHLMQSGSAALDRPRLAAIEAACPGLPLVIHGGSGISAPDRLALARETAVCKFNIGTELRQAFGASLRTVLAEGPGRFDRIEIMRKVMVGVREAARGVIGGCG